MGAVAYGQAGGSEWIFNVPVAANQTFTARGGKWMVMNASYAYLASAASITDILGWAMTGGTWIANPSAGYDSVPINMAADGVFEMPTLASRTETQLKAYIGRTCDINVSSSVQYADETASTYDQYQIVGYKYYGSGTNNQTLLVRRAPANSITLSNYTGVV